MTSADISAGSSKRKDITTSGNGKGTNNITKGWLEYLDAASGIGERAWCIVHLYREDEEATARNTPQPNISIAASNTISTPPPLPPPPSTEAKDISQDSSILCIPSIPSHITPSDFLSWVGTETLNKVSHFRMVMTEQPNRYLALIKFREAKDAKWWRKLWDGRLFDSGGGGVEEETASVLYVRRVIFETLKTQADTTTSASKQIQENGSERSYTSSSERSFPDMTHDPFTPAHNPTSTLNMSGNGNGNNSTLSEAPTCPVCLERMEIDSPDPASPSGLLTILCQHVFHCACIQKWRGSGCPVCRHTQNKSLPLRTYAGQQGRAPFGRNPGEAETCSVCGCEEDLWICLVCGNVGCGRYKGGHAKRHWMDSQQEAEEGGDNNLVGSHSYALEIETQYVWDYVGDKWVHRLIMGQGDGKLEYQHESVENENSGQGEERAGTNRQDMELVPREKLENLGHETTQFLTSCLDSQRFYFEDRLAKATAAATSSALQSTESRLAAMASHLTALQSENQSLSTELATLKETTIPSLERDLARTNNKATKSTDLARELSQKWSEEKEVSKGLLERIAFVNRNMATVVEKLEKKDAEMKGLEGVVRELREENRDLGFYISGGERVKELVEGQGGEEIREGVLSVGSPAPVEVVKGEEGVPVEKERGKGKGKGRAGRNK